MPPVIEIRVCGGLGNQLYQLAAALILGNKVGASIIANTAYLSSYAVKRPFSSASLFDLASLGIVNTTLPRWYHSLRMGRFVPGSVGRVRLVNDKTFGKALRDGRAFSKYLLDGYFIDAIDPEAFTWVKKLLQRAYIGFRLKSSSATQDQLLIHVRGGDFKDLRWALGRPYYSKAVELVLDKCPDISEALVVTDDEGYARHMLKEIPLSYRISTGNENDDFHAMTQAKWLVGSNSTFAFWAAALFDNSRAGLVVMPKSWRPGSQRRQFLCGEVALNA